MSGLLSATRQTGVVLVGSNGIDDRRQGARRQILAPPTVPTTAPRRSPLPPRSPLEIVADDTRAQDRPRLLAAQASRHVGPSLHPVGDVHFDVAGRHSAIERQDLHRRVLECRQDVDRDQGHANRPDQHDRQREDRHRPRVHHRGPDQPSHRCTSTIRTMIEPGGRDESGANAAGRHLVTA